jgi:hypothetical protein
MQDGTTGCLEKMIHSILINYGQEIFYKKKRPGILM